MIALTQEKREELKMFLSASIEKRCTVYTLAKQRELEALRDQVTLASLTAETIGWGLRSLKDSGRFGSFLNSSPREQSYLDYQPHDYENVPLYTAPPVPEIKFPNRNEIPDWVMDDDDFCTWYEAETKRLNGWG